MDFWYFITLLGGKEAYLFFIPLVYFLYSRKEGWRFMLLVAFSALIVQFLKETIREPRPPKSMWKVEVKGYSFPSAHATLAASTWCYLSSKIKNLRILAPFIVTLISVSRIVLGVHYWWDVVAGIILGLGICFLFLYLEKNFPFRKSRKRKEIAFFSLLLLLIIIIYCVGRVPEEPMVLAGMAAAHLLAVEILNFEELFSLIQRVVAFLFSSALIAMAYFLNIAPVYPVAGFLAIFLPQTLRKII